jgi:penicillin-binding protein 2
VLSTYRRAEPGVGRDLVLTLDPKLQAAAESLLDAALQRRRLRDAGAGPAGGAIVVMDVHTGALLAAASAPGFDPNLFAPGKDGRLEPLLADPAHPLFDRTAKMAIPPGSVFKVVTAAALLGSSAVDPAEPIFCRGYLVTPDRWRCAVYRRHGAGHGDVTLADALCESCNVYFFHHAGRMGPGPLVDCAGRFGFGRPTGVDLPGESPGTLPTPETIRELEGHPWHAADTRSVAIGQGSLEATPLQVARMIAAVANGGLLVTPHVVSRLGLPELAEGQTAADLPEDPIDPPPPEPIPDLDLATLAAIRAGLDRVVSDPRGTAHAPLWMATLPIAGKTGTAETSPDEPEHAWLAAYLPADRPRYALVVALEHAGNASETACPAARRIAVRMQGLGYLPDTP